MLYTPGEEARYATTYDELSPEAHEAIIACLRIAAKRGKQLRLERERASQTQIPQDSRTDKCAMPEVGDETGSIVLRTVG